MSIFSGSSKGLLIISADGKQSWLELFVLAKANAQHLPHWELERMT